MPNYLSPGVYVEEVEAGSRPIEGVGTAVAAFVGLAARGPANTPTLVTNWSQFTATFGEFLENSYLAHAVYGYFLNGGGAAYVVRVGADGAMPAAKAELPSGKEKETPSYRVTAIEAGPAGNEITVDVQSTAEGGEGTFRLVVNQGGRPVETFENVTTSKGKTNVVTVVKSQSKLITIEEVGSISAADRAPATGSITLVGGGSSVPVRVTPDDYVGNSADRTGFAGLEAVDEVTMLSVPDLMAVYQQGVIDLEGVQAVQLAMLAHAELMGDRVAILDAPPDLNAQQVKEWRVDKTGYDSKYATLYWPWLKVFDPISGQGMNVPPSGHIAGIWARNDDTRGVHKAPANEVIRGALALELQITKGEHDQLNPSGINCIRSFPGRGIRVWGARTLSSDPEFRYVNVRRFLIFLEASLDRGTQYVVFEPNAPETWSRVVDSVSAFLHTQWRNGALFGRRPEDAFFVRCDETTMTVDDIQNGRLICLIGVAIVRPAEFVIFRIEQITGFAPQP